MSSDVGGADQIRHIVVVGAGGMGSQIGLLCALAGYCATITDIEQNARDRAEIQLPAPRHRARQNR